jgi:hypothetical protein
MSRYESISTDRRFRRGGAYILVLGVAMLITVIGMAALLSTRLTGKEAGTSTDWEESGILAQAAVEHAISYLSAQAAANPTTWRSNFTSFVHGNTPAFTQSMGRGKWYWMVVDQVDGNFSNNYVDSFKLYGVGTVNNATRVFSVQVVPAGSPLPVLQCGLAAAGNITTNGTATISGGAPTANAPSGWTPMISTNGSISLGGSVYGTVQCVYRTSGSLVSGTVTTGVTQTMPSEGNYALYLAKATVIPFSALGTGSSVSVSGGTLNPTSNPFGATNPNGVYSVTVPANGSLQISSAQITGTILISMTSGTLTLTGPMTLQPARSDFPSLIVSATNSTINIQGSTTWLSNSNGDIAPQYGGVMHIIGSTNTINVTNNAYIYGSLIADGAVTTNTQATFISNPALYTNPPIGYGAGTQLLIVPGSWIWDSPP